MQNLIKKTADKKATYADANDLSYRLGQILAETFQETVSADMLPNNRMYYNIGQKAIAPMLENNYNIVADNAVDIQETLNELAGIGIKGQKPELSIERVEGIIQKIANEMNFDDAKWVLDDPVVNFTQSVVDDAVKANAKFHSEAGIRAQVVRIADVKACDWCRSLQGTYTYPGVPDDVFKRHQNDRCIIQYTPKGKRTEIL